MRRGSGERFSLNNRILRVITKTHNSRILLADLEGLWLASFFCSGTALFCAW